ncbi:MAG: 50S ribosomal protein L9, partial [Candidatus Omnitrophica bacterium]|nr:50S ribosomal protein L9 [Candidatus Omnitrophota bacterium]
MQVILLKDIKRLGKAGDVKRVANGYARNYLIPRGLAAVATTQAIKQARERLAAESRRTQIEVTSAESLAEIVDKLSFTFRVKAGDTGTLYGSITNADIATRLEKEIGQAFDKRKILLEQPIKELGTYTVEVKLISNVTPTV